MNRRGILRSAAAGVSLLLPHGRSVLAAALNARSGAAPMALIYDERHDDARALAAYFRARGTIPYPTRGDATGHWYGALGTLHRQHGGTVAGLTTWSDLVIARSRGRELGLRLVFERTYLRGFDWRGFDWAATPGAPVDAFAGFVGGNGPGEPLRETELMAWRLEPRSC